MTALKDVCKWAKTVSDFGSSMFQYRPGDWLTWLGFLLVYGKYQETKGSISPTAKARPLCLIFYPFLCSLIIQGLFL